MLYYKGFTIIDNNFGNKYNIYINMKGSEKNMDSNPTNSDIELELRNNFERIGEDVLAYLQANSIGGDGTNENS